MSKKGLPRNEVLRGALVGGGGGAFIARRHEFAVHMPGTRRFVCGALHPDPDVAMREARNWPYPLQGYPSLGDLIEDQLSLPKTRRIHFATVATPNNVHFEQAMALIQAGIPVCLEKPMVTSSEQARELVAAAEEAGVPLMVFHTYWGHAMTCLAAHIVQSGLIGDVFGGKAEYDQDWLREMLEAMGVVQAWRAKKAVSGMSCCGGDIGIHGQKQFERITGLKVAKILYARLRTVVPRRELDDDFLTVCRLDNDAEVIVRASQVRAGHRNRLVVEVNGTKGTLIQDAENPEELQILRPNKPVLIYRRGQFGPNDGFLRKVPKWILNANYWPAGHPEGLHDAACRLYDWFAADVRRYYRGKRPMYAGVRYAGVQDGLEHIKFLEAAVEAAERETQVDIAA